MIFLVVVLGNLNTMGFGGINPNDQKNVIVADIDGCCVFSEHRIPFLLEGNIDSYHQNHIHDHPIPQGVVIYRKLLNDPCFRVVFVTGRVEAAREYTLKQLRRWVHAGITSEQLLMRPQELSGEAGLGDDTMHDVVLKPKLLRDVGIEPHHIFLVFEDRSSVVKMWRKLGVVVYQTAFGDF